MKTILVLTDFSENAKHAAKTAVLLALKINADILLFNTILQVAEIPAYADGAFFSAGLQRWQEASQESLAEQKVQLENFLNTCDFAEDQKRPLIRTRFGEGNLNDYVETISSDKEICLIIMGGRSNSAIDHILFGCDTTRVIERALKPVLVITPNADVKSFQNITFATDYEHADIKALEYLDELAGYFSISLKVLHIDLSDKDKEKLDLDELIIAGKLQDMYNTKAILHEVSGRKLDVTFEKVCENSDADILAVVHHKTGIISELFNQSTTLNLLKKQTLPILIFPPHMK